MIIKNNKKNKTIKNKSNKKVFFNKNLNKNKFNYFNYLKKKKKQKITNYLYINKKLKTGIFLKTPVFNEIKYPIPFNLKLIYEFLKKK
jgi:hypothetical protein